LAVNQLCNFKRNELKVQNRELLVHGFDVFKNICAAKQRNSGTSQRMDRLTFGSAAVWQVLRWLSKCQCGQC